MHPLIPGANTKANPYLWVRKNDTQWQAAIAHCVYVCATALLSEGELANEYT
jgi:hypothetical protein